ncbi:hypothetical protein RPC_3751 [Rhodopseudomonas palustris BisB18]|uniref:Uncharacterized protein n=1 Tax=Rhodopseudomonas palustris (strain BisB18) TaxID=316056 RepID=Q210A0_RHOPB
MLADSVRQQYCEKPREATVCRGFHRVLRGFRSNRRGRERPARGWAAAASRVALRGGGISLRWIRLARRQARPRRQRLSAAADLSAERASETTPPLKILLMCRLRRPRNNSAA